ncbi:MAG: hypothetical protein V4515_06025 [Chloroflexota bacterium]
MKAFVAALIVWNLATFAFAVFHGGAVYTVGCMRTIGGPTAACEAYQAAVNDVIFRYDTLPLLTGYLAGYVGIVLVRIRGRRRQRVSKERLERP